MYQGASCHILASTGSWSAGTSWLTWVWYRMRCLASTSTPPVRTGTSCVAASGKLPTAQRRGYLHGGCHMSVWCKGLIKTYKHHEIMDVHLAILL